MCPAAGDFFVWLTYSTVQKYARRWILFAVLRRSSLVALPVSSVFSVLSPAAVVASAGAWSQMLTLLPSGRLTSRRFPRSLIQAFTPLAVL